MKWKKQKADETGNLRPNFRDDFPLSYNQVVGEMKGLRLLGDGWEEARFVW
jgi:hypothetical protein